MSINEKLQSMKNAWLENSKSSGFNEYPDGKYIGRLENIELNESEAGSL